MSFGLSWREGALKDLDNLEIFLKKRIVKKIMEFVESESFHGIKKMYGSDCMYRLRIGNYRAIFEMIDSVVVVTKIGHRGKIY